MSDSFRGYPIYLDGGAYRFADTGEPTAATYQDRPCGHCGLADSEEGHDGCLGTLTGVVNACCGHGLVDDAYVVLTGGDRLAGAEALAWIEQHRSREVQS